MNADDSYNEFQNEHQNDIFDETTPISTKMNQPPSTS